MFSDRKSTKSGRKIWFSFFYEFLNFETEKFKISPENSFRVVPETEFFSEIRIFRSENFSLAWTSSTRLLIGMGPACRACWAALLPPPPVEVHIQALLSRTERVRLGDEDRSRSAHIRSGKAATSLAPSFSFRSNPISPLLCASSSSPCSPPN